MMNDEMPVGFSMALAQHADVMIQFARLPEAERNAIIEQAKQVASHDEMRHYVENLFQDRSF